MIGFQVQRQSFFPGKVNGFNFRNLLIINIAVFEDSGIFFFDFFQIPVFSEIPDILFAMTNEIEFDLLRGFCLEDDRIVAALFLIPRLQICDVEINPQGVLAFVDRHDILRQLLEAEHVPVLLPVDLERAIGERGEEVAQLSVLPQPLHIVETLPAEHLCDLFDPVAVPQNLDYVRLHPGPHSERFFYLHLLSRLAAVDAGTHPLHVDDQRTAVGIGSVFDQLLHSPRVSTDRCDHQGRETEGVALVHSDVDEFVAAVVHYLADLLASVNADLMQFVHAGIEGRGNTENP